MAHKVVIDTDIFPRMNRDIARHRERLRNAIKNNIESVIANEGIITAEEGKIIRVPVQQMKEWSFEFSESETRVGQGDGRRKITCPACKGAGCDVCNNIGIVTEGRAKVIREWLYEQEHGPSMLANVSLKFDADLISSLSKNDDEIDSENISRRGESGRPRSRAGDRIFKERPDGSSDETGEKPGVDIFETEITIEELEDIVFETLHLPLLEDRGKMKIKSEIFHFDEVKKTGPMSSVERKLTMKANMLRNAKETGVAKVFGINNQDLRFHTFNMEEKEEAAAVVMAIMDVSGSMTEFKKFICRTFFSWMIRFLRTQYSQVEIVFIAHHSTAKEVSEEDFFHRVESGGTVMSSGWKKALQIMRERYDPKDWNIYAYHFSDGENSMNDNEELVLAIKEVLDYPVNMAGYGEITAKDPYNPWPFWASFGSVKSTLEKFFDNDESRFIIAEINDKTHIWQTLQRFFMRDANMSNDMGHLSGLEDVTDE